MTTTLMKKLESKKDRLLSIISVPTFAHPSSLRKKLKHMKLTMILTCFRNMKLNFLSKNIPHSYGLYANVLKNLAPLTIFKISPRTMQSSTKNRTYAVPFLLK